MKRERTNGEAVSPPPVKRRQQSTTTQKSVANFFKPASQKEPEKVTWRIVEDSLLVGKYNGGSTGLQPHDKAQNQRVAAFDFDSTLIISASGKKFATDATDWKWWHATVPGTLKQMHQEGYLLVILSNQGGLSLNNDTKSAKLDLKRLSDFKRKVTAVFMQLDLPLSIYVATGRDRFRKPRTGMWTVFLRDTGLNFSNAVDLPNSIFIGDAGGRCAIQGGPGKDFASSDRDFSHNIGISFKAPEEFFLNEKARPFVRDFDPSLYTAMLGDGKSPTQSPHTLTFTRKNELDIILLCGSPGAGKSTFYWHHCKPLGYERVNQDILKTRERCIQVASNLVKEQKSVVVDNTNADPETRRQWVQLANKFNVPIRCLLFTASAKLCEHNDAVRALNASAEGLNPEKRSMLPKAAFTGFAARYREPTLNEGFQDIVKVDFVYEGTEEQKAIWSKFWI